MPRKTMRMTEIRAAANRFLAGSDPELTDFRRGVASMYEHLALAANDYHGFNDIVQLWAGEPGDSAYVPDEAYRRHYYGGMSGPDAEVAEEAIKLYRADTGRWGPDPEIARRKAEVTRLTIAGLREKGNQMTQPQPNRTSGIDRTLAFTALLELHPKFAATAEPQAGRIVGDLAAAMTAANPKDRWAFAKQWIERHPDFEHRWICVVPEQGPDATYRCNFCPAEAKGSEIGVDEKGAK